MAQNVVGTVFSVVVASLVGTPAWAGSQDSPGKPTQYVLISFDGAHKIDQWKRSRALAERTGARFTYFLSCVFLLTPQTKSTYHPPDKKVGASNVGFAQSKVEVAERLQQIRLATAEANELASHGCGHFDGGTWTAKQWRQEFSAFRDTLAGAYRINGLATPSDWWMIAKSVQGFRAPYLSTGPGLYKALATDGFAYDASGVSRGPAVPYVKRSPVRFALPMIPEGPDERRVIAMDYNLFVRHSGGKEAIDQGGVFEGRTLAAFRSAFDKQYNGERTPLQIGFHFSLMNGAAYWRALERFAQETCRRPDVECITYRDYLSRIQPTGAEHAG